jgi:hypothetical protein
MTEEPNGQYDPALMLTRAAIAFVGVMMLFVGGIIIAQIVKGGEANTESWAALTGLIGWATGQASIVFSNRFGTTSQSAKKDAVIEQQAKTAAVIAAAPFPDPATPKVSP